MDPVSSTSSQKTPSIPRCTNVLTSSHRLLLSWSRLQLFNFAVGFHLRRQRHVQQLGLVIQWGHRSRAVAAVQSQGSTPSPGSTSGSPGSKFKSSRPQDARGVLERNTRDFRSASGSPYLHVLGGQCVCVCASSNPHRCLETRGVCLRCTSPVQPDRSSSRAPSLPTRRCLSAPASEMCSAELL